MSLINDYSASILSAQRQRELQNEARDARLASGHRAPWWQRLAGVRGRGRLSGSTTNRPIPIAQHRAAH